MQMKILEEDVISIAKAHGFHVHLVKDGKRVSFFLYKQSGCNCLGLYVFEKEESIWLCKSQYQCRTCSNELEQIHAFRKSERFSERIIPVTNLKGCLLTLISELKD